jgi:hypothetical protein
MGSLLNTNKKIPNSLVGKLPPLGFEHSLLTLFLPVNSDVFHLTISGLSRKIFFTTQKEKVQDISEKRVEILTEK